MVYESFCILGIVFICPMCIAQRSKLSFIETMHLMHSPCAPRMLFREKSAFPYAMEEKA